MHATYIISGLWAVPKYFTFELYFSWLYRVVSLLYYWLGRMKSLRKDIEYRWCRIIASRTDYQFENQRLSEDAVALQQRNYKRLLTHISRPQINGSSADLDLWQYLEAEWETFGNTRTISRENKFIVKAQLPLLTSEDVENVIDLYNELLKTEGDIGQCLELALFIAASLNYCIYRSRIFNKFINFGRISELINFATIRFVSVNELIEFNDGGMNNVASTVERFKLEVEEKSREALGAYSETVFDLASIKQGKEKLDDSLSKLKLDLKNADETIRSNIKQDRKKIEEDLKSFIDQFDAQKNALEKRLELNALGGLWASVAQRSKWATGITSLAITLLVGFGVFVAYNWGSDIVGFIVKSHVPADGGNQINNIDGDWIGLQVSRIFIVSVPTILYVWLIKLLVRFLFRSLALYDDAVQRKTIMDSYFMLSERNAVDDKILPLIIWALCRQVPGHGPDGIEPPDFSEVINAGLNFGRKSQ